MKLMKGDIWSIYNQTDRFLFTGNSTIKSNGALVMGEYLPNKYGTAYQGALQKLFTC